MITSTTWSLAEMCKTHLKSDRQEIDFDDTANYFDGSVSSPEPLLNSVRHCELDAHYQMALGHKVQLLSLTRQLTNLAGNSVTTIWSLFNVCADPRLFSQEQDPQRRPRGAE